MKRNHGLLAMPERLDIYEIIANQLEEVIVRENLQPGKKLMSDQELARNFDVSRPTIGAVLQLLEQRGLVMRKVGRVACGAVCLFLITPGRGSPWPGFSWVDPIAIDSLSCFNYFGFTLLSQPGWNLCISCR